MTHYPTKGFQVGDVLESSWGYDQTNATFYKIVKRTPSMVTVHQMQKERVWSDDGYDVLGVVPSDKPVLRHDASDCEWSQTRSTLDVIGEWHYHLADAETLDCFQPAESRHKVNEHGYIKIASYANAHPWDGTPQYDTSASGQMGH